jgi:hypothetical protein
LDGEGVDEPRAGGVGCEPQFHRRRPLCFGWTERLLIAAHNVRECSATNPNKTDFNRDVQKQKMAPV